MSNIVRFPNGRGYPSAAPASQLDALVAEVTAVELELARARLGQIRSETRQAQALWGWWCFKRCLVWGCVLWLLVTCAKADPINTRKTFYGSNGSFAGTSLTRGNSGSYYDGAGRFSGSSVRIGPTTNYYDHQGRYSGSTVRR